MARPTTKDSLIEAANLNFEKMWKVVDSMTDKALNKDFDFSTDLKKKEAHWERDKNIRDIFIHLYEWHQLLLDWIKANKIGNTVAFLPKPFTWKSYGELNIIFWEKHQDTNVETSKEMLNTSHKDVLELVKSFSEEELFTKKYFDWTGSTSLGSYCVSAIPSHYDWAIKKLRAHIKKVS